LKNFELTLLTLQLPVK